MDAGVAGKVYVVTGGTRGLGFATAAALRDGGASVLVTGRNPDSVASASEKLGVAGVVADLGDPSSADLVIEQALTEFGRLDGALISVGGPPTGTVMDTPDDVWSSAFASVFVGAVRMARTVATAIEGPGSIAFVLSSSVRAPLANLAVSNGLRPGLAMVAKTLADELGPRGIRVNGLLPGRIATDRLAELDASTGDAVAARDAAITGIPLGRYGEPSEFARAAVFLLGDQSSFVTGVMLPVDGGMSRGL